MDSIQDLFRSRGVVRGGLLMLRPAEAIELVRECRARGVAVADVEGFRLYADGGTQPFMEHSLGLGLAPLNPNVEGNCWDLAEGFLRKYLQTDMHFNVTVARGDETGEVDLDKTPGDRSVMLAIRAILAQHISEAEKARAIREVLDRRTRQRAANGEGGAYGSGA